MCPQRTKSWDLAAHRKFFSVLSFLLCYWRRQHLCLKPFMLGEVPHSCAHTTAVMLGEGAVAARDYGYRHDCNA